MPDRTDGPVATVPERHVDLDHLADLTGPAGENNNLVAEPNGFGKVVGEMLAGVGAILMFAIITILITFGLLLAYCRCPRGA